MAAYNNNDFENQEFIKIKEPTKIKTKKKYKRKKTKAILKNNLVNFHFQIKRKII